MSGISGILKFVFVLFANELFPLDDAHGAAATDPSTPTRLHRHPRDGPVTASLPFDLDIGDAGLADVRARLCIRRHLIVLNRDDGIDDLTEDESLRLADGELMQVDHSRGERNRSRFNRGHAQDRHEDPAPRGELDDESQHSGRQTIGALGDNDVPDAPDFVTIGPCDGHPG